MRWLYILIFCLTGVDGIAQEAQFGGIEERIYDYFESDRPSFHIHTNKTTYLPGEDIWFSLKAKSRKSGAAFNQALNVYVEFINKEGHIIDNAFLLLKDGVAHNSFLLSEKLEQGTYFLRAYSASMLGLREDESFSMAIQVIDLESYVDNSLLRVPPYTLNLYPESGNLIEGIPQRIGVRLTDSLGRITRPDELYVVNRSGKVIKNDISIDQHETGQIGLIPDNKRELILKARIRDTVISAIIPKANDDLSISVIPNSNFRNIVIRINADPKQISKLIKQQYLLLLHQNGASKSFEIGFTKDHNMVELQFKNTALFQGVNTISLFDASGKLIAERLYYQYHTNPHKPEISWSGRENDSLEIVFKGKTKSNLSVSILPMDTESITNHLHTYEAFQLEPYLKNKEPDLPKRENEVILFLQDMDRWLLSYSEAKYDYRYMRPDMKGANSENPGILIDGYVRPVNPKEEVKTVWLYGEEDKAMRVHELGEDLSYSFNNLMLTLDSEVSLSAFDSKGIPVKSNFFSILKPDSLSMREKSDFKPYFPFGPVNRSDRSELSIFAEGQQLDTVVIEGVSRKREGLLKEFSRRKMDSTDLVYGTLRQYIKINFGYSERNIPRPLPGFNHPGGFTLFRTVGRGSRIPIVILNGETLSTQSGKLYYPMSYIDEIYANDPSGDVLLVFTKKRLPLRESQKTARSLTITNGFDPPKEFSLPNYYSYQSESFRNFGVIHWEPEVKIEPEKQSLVTFSKLGNEAFIMIVEGITDEGEPISEKIPIVLKPED